MTLSHWHHNVTRTTSCVTRTINELAFSVALLSDMHLAFPQLRKFTCTYILSCLHLAYICLFTERVTTTKYLVLSISEYNIYFCSFVNTYITSRSLFPTLDTGSDTSANGQERGQERRRRHKSTTVIQRFARQIRVLESESSTTQIVDCV